jgi:hypothetical protein
LGRAKPEVNNAYTTFSTAILELFFKEFCSTRQEDELLRPLIDYATWPVSSPVLRFEQQLRVYRRTFLHSDYYNHLWRPVDNCNPLMLGLREAGRVRGVLQVYRAREERPFPSVGPNQYARRTNSPHGFRSRRTGGG